MKKALIIASVILIILVTITVILSLIKKSANNQSGQGGIFPTSIPLQGNQQNNQPSGSGSAGSKTSGGINQPDNQASGSSSGGSTTSGNVNQPSGTSFTGSKTSGGINQPSGSGSGGSTTSGNINQPSGSNSGRSDAFAPNGIPQGNQQNNQGSNTSDSTNNSSVDISTFQPVETLDFKAAYVENLNKIVVEEKTPQAEELFNQWLHQNQLNDVVNQNEIMFTDQKIIPTPSDAVSQLQNKILSFFQLLDDLNAINNQPTPTEVPTPMNIPTSTPLPTGNTSNKVYYAQCGDPYGSLPFASGCTLCYAGCGPTTVAMIASSYINSSYNPQAIINLYKSNSYYLGCDGTTYTDAYKLFQKLGFQTTTIYEYNFVTSDKIVPDIRNYLANGWSIFTLVSGHFFWITDIDSQGNIFAYDPVYSPPPYNENSHNPARKYYRIFGVKK